MYEDRVASLRAIVETAHGVAASLEAEVAKGTLSREEAQRRFTATLTAMRYGAGEYIFVNDFDSVGVVHPARPESVGKDMSGLKDSNGFPFARAMSDLAKGKGEGVIEYWWPKAGGVEPQPKAAYVKAFVPWRYAIGTGVYMDDLWDDFATHALWLIAIITLLTLPLVLAVGYVGLSVSGTIRRMGERMRRLAAGDLDQSFAEAARGDEIGEMARAVEVFRDNAVAKRKLEEERAEAGQRAESDKRRSLHHLADTFERTVGGVLGAVMQETAAMQVKTNSMTAATAETDRLAATMAAATGQTAANVQLVATTSEELSHSIDEIARQVTRSSEIASQAVGQADRANERISGLAEAVERIGAVVGLINSIASQTNLLALNATIEAARAGEAGKGFAVVAGEVKHLASQTAKATEEIGAQVAAIQAATGDTVTEINGVGQIIARMNQIASAIASAVEEQGAATREIARNIQQAAVGTTEVSSSITGVTAAADQSGKVARDLHDSFSQLSGQAGALKTEVERFLATVRAA
ncbi:methyl-accepting chemotaxis protein [Azospirillum oleiclasticum]|nr:cache domain-containing protein [Azospirillum oleiclasticum]